MFKQAIVVRTDLGMGKGKLVAQCSHASLEAFLKTGELTRRAWRAVGAKKIVLKVAGEKELLEIQREAQAKKLPTALVHDAGHTQIPAGTATAVAIGPANEQKIDEVTGKLKLL